MAPLAIEAGKLYNVYIASMNAASEASDPVLVPPMRLMAIGKVFAPGDVHICDANQDDHPGCTTDRSSFSLIVTWLKPVETGAGAQLDLPISRYEVVLSEDESFSTALKTVNISTADAEVEGNVCRLVITGLPKGKAFVARVRGYNSVGAGEWGQTSGVPRIVLSLPGAVGLPFIGSGAIPHFMGSALPALPFLTLFWKAPRDRGGGDDSKFNITIQGYTVQLGTSANLDDSALLSRDVDNRTATFNGDMVNWTIYSGNSVPLTLGTRYFVRIRARNGIGFGNWSVITHKILIQEPGLPRNVQLRTVGPLTLNVSWTEPEDTGAGAGNTYPLLSYQVVIQLSAGQPDLHAATSHTQIVSGRTKTLVVSSLQRGAQYFTFVRARNNASDHPDKVQYGYGPWALGTAACLDGMARPSVCSGYGVIAIGLPSIPNDFQLRPVGSGVLMSQWTRPEETGNGSRLYPLVRYDVQFAADEQFSDGEVFSADGRLNLYRTVPGQYATGHVKFSRVRAMNDAGVSEWSEIASATVLHFPTRPRNLNATNGNLSLLVTFERPINTGTGTVRIWPLLWYELEITPHPYTCPEDANRQRTLQVANFSQLEKNNYTVIGLRKGCEYSFRMRVKNDAGFSNYTEPVLESFLECSQKPTNLVAEPGSALQMILNWETPLDTGDGTRNDLLIIKYLVHVSNSSTFHGPLLRSMETSAKTLTLAFLPRVLLHVRVLPVTRAGLGHFAQASATPIIPELRSTAVILSSLTTGATSEATVRMTTTAALLPNHKISVRFPHGFQVSEIQLGEQGSPTALPTMLNIDRSARAPCGTDCEDSPETVTLNYVGATELPASSSIVLSFKNIKNRRWAGPAEPFELRVLNQDGTFTIAEALNVSECLLLPGALVSPSIKLEDDRTGMLCTALVQFTVGQNNLWLPDDQALLEFPHSFDLSGSVNVHDLVGDRGSSLNMGFLRVVSLSNNLLRIARSGGDAIPVGTKVLFSVSNIRNSIFANESGPVSLKLLTNSSHIIDQASFAGILFKPGNLSNTSVTPLRPAAYAMSDFKVCFRSGAVGVPPNSVMRITFPAVHFLQDATFGSAEGIDGTFEISVEQQVLHVFRTGEATAVLPHSYLCLLVRNIRNHYAGTTLPYAISVLTRSNVVMEEDLTVAGSMIQAANLTVSRLELSSHYAGADTQIEIDLEIAGALNFRGAEGGRVIVEFPSGFEINPGGESPLQLDATVQAPAQGTLQLVGTWTGMSISLYPVRSYTLPIVPCSAKTWFVCGSGAAIELQGGNEWLPGSKFSMRLSGLRTRPFAGRSSAFRIYTLNADNRLSDLSSNRWVRLVPNRLHSVSAGPNPLMTNKTVEIRFSFLTTNVVPENCQIEVFFPPAYSMTPSLKVRSLFNKLALSVSHVSKSVHGTNVTIARHMGQVMPRRSNVTFFVSGVRTQSKSGPSGICQIRVKTAENYTIDEDQQVDCPLLEYDWSVPRTVLPFPNRPSSGNMIVTIAGRGFGNEQHLQPQSEYRATRIGQTACSSTSWLSDSALTCLLAAGVLPSNIMVTIERKVATGNFIFSFDLPFANSSQILNFPTSGASSVLSGGNFGTFATSLAVRSGFTATENTHWISDTSVFTRSPRSVGGSISLVMTAGHFPGSAIDFVSFDASTLSSTSRSNIPASTHKLMHVGHDFGLVDSCPQLRIHGTHCMATSWVSQSCLQCRVTSGIGSNVTAIAVTVAGLVGTMSGAVSFDAPSLSSVSKSEDQEMLTTGDEGVRVFNLMGAHFDRADMSGVVRLGDTQCSSTIWKSDTSLSCRINSFVNMMSLDISYKVAHHQTELSGVFSIDGPALSAVSRGNIQPIVQRIEMQVFGKNFGANMQTFAIRMGGTTSLSTIWMSDTSLISRPARGLSAGVDLVVSISRAVGTASNVLTYDAPTVSSTGPHLGWANLPASGRAYLTVAGTNLGFLATSHKLRIGMTDCERQGWTSDSTITCKTPHGWESSVESVITVAREYGGRTNFYSYDLPSFRLPKTSNLPTISLHQSSTASIAGSNFGSYSKSTMGRAGLSSCSSTVWSAETAMSCRAVDGVGSYNTVVLTVARLQASGSVMLSYDAPLLRVLDGANLPVAGQGKLMEGSNLGSSDFSSRYRAGDSACLASRWFSDSSLLCKLSVGQGHHLDFVITLGGEQQSAKRLFSYDLAVADRILATNSGPSEATFHTVAGKSFSLFSISQQTSVGFSNSVMSEWISDSSLTLRVANGLSGRGESVIVSVAMERKTSRTSLFTYDGPAILDVTGRAEGINGDHVTLSGIGFGSHDYTIRAMISTYGCISTGWVAETSIICKLNPGVVAGEVTLSAVRDSSFCRKCVPGLELLIGCRKGIGASAGFCAPCTSCPLGYFRDCDAGGTGECLPCKNSEEFVDQRFFKDIQGKGTTQCTNCTVCGGRDQDGSSYEVSRCTLERDTVCQSCPTCLSGIRIGCSEYFEGTCDTIADGVPGITATASGHLRSQQLYDSKHLTTEAIMIRLTGENLGTSLALPSNTLIDFPRGIAQNLSISAIIPSEAMLAAARDKDILTQGRRSWFRRAETRLQMMMLSKIHYLAPSGIRLAPRANLTFKVDLSSVTDPELAALYRWDQGSGRWRKQNTELVLGEGQARMKVENFSSYVIMAPANVTLSDQGGEGMPYQFLVIILTTLAILSILVCVLVYMMRRQRKREAAKVLKASPHVRLMDSPMDKPSIVRLPTPSATPRTPHTPRGSASSPLTPYRAVGDTERTASWKRQFYSRDQTRVTSPVPKLSFSSLFRGPRDAGGLDSPNTRVPELSANVGTSSEWGFGSARRYLTRTQTPQTRFSSRSSSRDPSPTRRDLESNLELLASSFAPQMRMMDAARKGITKDPLPPSHPPSRPIPQVPQLTPRSQQEQIDEDGPMGFDVLVRTDERARAVLSPSASSPTRKSSSPGELRAVPLPEPTFRRSRNLPKQEPIEDLLIRSDDYGDKSGVGLDRKRVRYSLPARVPQRTTNTRKSSEKPARLHGAPSAVSALSPRKIEFKEQISTPDRLRQHVGDQIRRAPHMTPRADDDRPPVRHQGPRDRSHESAYSLSPSSRSPSQSPSRTVQSATSANRMADAQTSTPSAQPAKVLQPGIVKPQGNVEPVLAYAVDKGNEHKMLESLPIEDLQRLAAGKPPAEFVAIQMWASDQGTTSDDPERPETPESTRLRQQHEIMDQMTAAQTGFSLAARSPARAWDQRDRNLQTQRLQQPNTASYSRAHSSPARPRSPEFSVR